MWRWLVALGLVSYAGWLGIRAVHTARAGLVLRYHRTATALSEINGSFPNHPRVVGELGHFYLYDVEAADPKLAYQQLKNATDLAPHEYRWWVLRAKAAELSDHSAEVRPDLEQAQKLAPAYFQTNWELAIFHLKAGDFTQATPYLQTALKQDATFAPYGVQLLWDQTNGDLARLQSVLPDTEPVQWEVVKFLFESGKVAEGMTAWNGFQGKGTGRFAKYAPLVMKYLVEGHFHHQAWELWRHQDWENRAQLQIGTIFNGNFAGPIDETNTQFDWRFPTRNNLQLALDSPPPGKTGKSLVLTFEGEAGGPFLSQLIPVQPLARYKLTFWTKSQQLTTGTALGCRVQATFPKDATLAEVTPSLLGTQVWKQAETTFEVPAEVTAIQLAATHLRGCPPGEPCPVFGRLWMGDFVLERIP